MRGRALAIGLLSRIATLVYLVPIIPVRYKACRLLVAVLLPLSQVYVVGMHGYLMHRYWYNKTVTSSQGLVMELLLYISAAFTFPIMTFYLLLWEFASDRFFTCCAGQEVDTHPLPCHQVGYSSVFLPNGTKVWLERVEHEARAVSAEPPEYSTAVMESGPSASPQSFEQKEDDLLAFEVAGRHSGGRCTRATTPKKSGVHCLDDSDCEDAEAGIAAKLLLQQSNASTSNVKISVKSAGNWSSCFGLLTKTKTLTRPTSDYPWVFLASIVGNSLVIAYIAFDLGHERVFDEKNIRKFMVVYHLSFAEITLYWSYVFLCFWGMFSSITACTVFHALCVEERHAMDLVVAILQKSTNLDRAGRLIDELVDFLCQRRFTMRAWFCIHTICFGAMLFLQLYFLLPSRHRGSKLLGPKNLLAARGTHANHKAGNSTSLLPVMSPTDSYAEWWAEDVITLSSKAVSILILLFKFAYPLFQAATITHHWGKAVPQLNLNEHMSLSDKNRMIKHWENHHSAYTMFGVKLSGGRAIAFALSILLLLFQI